jgi:hypothetical protein
LGSQKGKGTKNKKTLRNNRGQTESTHAGKQKTPTTSHGFDRIKSEANIVRFEEGEAGKIMVDPLNLSSRWWVKETSINNFIRPTGVRNGDWGDESDLLTLRSNLLVSSAVAGRMSQLILQDYPQYDPGSHFVINPTFVVVLEQGLIAHTSTLPLISHEHVKLCVFDMVSMMKQHAWLSVIDFPILRLRTFLCKTGPCTS